MKITDALVAEHRIFLGIFDEIERALREASTPAQVRTFARMVEGLLETHAETERNLAYLALDHVLAERGRLDRLHEEHEEIDGNLFRALEANDFGDARRHLRTALSVSRRHFRFEERNVFPLLEQVLSSETLLELGRIWLHQGERVDAPQPVC